MRLQLNTDSRQTRYQPAVGAHISNRPSPQVPITLCPVSNMRLQVYAGQLEARVREVLASGINVTVRRERREGRGNLGRRQEGGAGGAEGQGGGRTKRGRARVCVKSRHSPQLEHTPVHVHTMIHYTYIYIHVYIYTLIYCATRSPSDQL